MNGNLYALIASRFPADRTRPFLETLGGDDQLRRALETGVGRLAALLKAKGVAPGDRVAVQTRQEPRSGDALPGGR